MQSKDKGRRYRVVAGDSVLNYYSTRDLAVWYMGQLEKHSPDTYACAVIQVQDVHDQYVYHDLSPLCWR